MRLTSQQVHLILDTVRACFGADARVSVYGSRLDEAARGGDIDLLVETARPPTFRQRVDAVTALERALGRPVDLLAVWQHEPAPAPFVAIARCRAIPLHGEPVQPAHP